MTTTRTWIASFTIAAALVAAGCSGESSSTGLAGGETTSTAVATSALEIETTVGPGGGLTSTPSTVPASPSSTAVAPTTDPDVDRDPVPGDPDPVGPVQDNGVVDPGNTATTAPTGPTTTVGPATTITLPVFAPPTTIEPLPPVGSNANLEVGGVCSLLDDRSVTDAFGDGITTGEAGTIDGEIVCRWHTGNPEGDRVVISADDPQAGPAGVPWASFSAPAGSEPETVGDKDGVVERFGDGARVTFEGLDLTVWTVSVVHPDGIDESAAVALDVARQML